MNLIPYKQRYQNRARKMWFRFIVFIVPLSVSIKKVRKNWPLGKLLIFFVVEYLNYQCKRSVYLEANWYRPPDHKQFTNTHPLSLKPLDYSHPLIILWSVILSCGSLSILVLVHIIILSLSPLSRRLSGDS